MITKKEAGVFLVYYGCLLLLLPMVMPPLPPSVTLTGTPLTFDFEDDLGSVHNVHGSPTIVGSPVANGSKAVECQGWDSVGWELAKPSKTMDLAFKIYWTKLPTAANESFVVGEIYGEGESGWQDIFTTSLYCDQNGYRGWTLWTGIPSGRGAFVSGDVVYALETSHWYTVRLTADLDSGVYRVYMDGNELAAITDVAVPADIYIDFFRLGGAARGSKVFTNYYDNVIVSLLGAAPASEQRPDPNPGYNWIPVQVTGVAMIGVGGYLLGSHKMRKLKT